MLPSQVAWGSWVRSERIMSGEELVLILTRKRGMFSSGWLSRIAAAPVCRELGLWISPEMPVEDRRRMFACWLHAVTCQRRRRQMVALVQGRVYYTLHQAGIRLPFVPTHSCLVL